MTISAAVHGWGHSLPELIDCGGVRRPIAVDPVGPSTLATPASQRALQSAGLSVDELDQIIFATMTPDVGFPGASCFLQRELGAGTIAALDLRGQCAGFLYGLAVANDFIMSGSATRVLLVGAEVHSAGLDYSPAGLDVAQLFGDGAGAAVLGVARGSGQLRSVVLHSDGAQYDRFWCEYPASRQHPARFTIDDLRRGGHFPAIDTEAVRRAGESQLPQAIDEALAQAGLTAAAIDCFVISHVFPEVARGAGDALGASAGRLLIPGGAWGHIAAAALPLAVSTALSEGQLGPGATICLAAAGAGFSWGAAVLTL